MLEKLEEIYSLIEDLDIKPTMANTERLLQIEYGLRDIYAAVKAERKEENENGGDQTDPEG